MITEERLSKIEERAMDVDLSFDPKDVIITRYEDMTREELIECCKAHDAHHEEHHLRERGLVEALRFYAHDAFTDSFGYEYDNHTDEGRKAREALAQFEKGGV